jgi:cell wall assembly regulator SMI1
MKSYTTLVEEVKMALPIYAKILMPGASEEQIEHFRSTIGYEIPESLLQFYKVCNGSEPYQTFDIEGMCLKGIDRILHDKKMFDEILDEKNAAGDYFCWHKDWIAFADDFSYDTLAIDTTGRVTGIKGCILERSKDMFEGDPICIIAPDFDTFIRGWAQRALEGQVYHVDQKNENGMNEENYDDHFEHGCVKRVVLGSRE